MSNETLEIVARAIYTAQCEKVRHRNSVNACRAWRSSDVPQAFWDGYISDAKAAIAAYTAVRNVEVLGLAALSGEST